MITPLPAADRRALAALLQELLLSLEAGERNERESMNSTDTVVIIGGSSGMGLAVARRCLADGAPS